MSNREMVEILNQWDEKIIANGEKLLAKIEKTRKVLKKDQGDFTALHNYVCKTPGLKFPGTCQTCVARWVRETKEGLERLKMINQKNQSHVKN